MKNRRGMAVAAAFLAAAALAAGFFLPDLAGRVADQKLSVQAETFAIGKVPSAADARLVDMLKLADIYENELYLDHGAVSDESDIRISAVKMSDHTSELKSQIIDSKMSDSTTLQTVVSKVLKKGNVSIKDKDLQNILSSSLGSSSSSK